MPNTGKQTVRASTPAKGAALARVRRANKRPDLAGSSVNRNHAMIGMELAHEVCAITNPFCDASRGSKWPDQSAGQTLAIPVRMRYNVITDAAGNAGVVFTSRYSQGILPGTMTGSTFEWNSVVGPPVVYDTEEYKPDFTSADQYRVVSAGIRVTPVTSAMNSQGIVNIIELPVADSQEDYQIIDTATKNYPSYESLPLKAHDSIYAVMRPNGATAREFRDTIGDSGVEEGTEFSTGDWTSILVNITGGAASTTVAVIDVFLNYEVTFNVSSSNGFLTTRAPLPNLTLTNASTAITQGTAIHRGTDKSVDETFLSKAWGYLKSAGAFVKENGRAIVNIGAAGVHAYTGNYATAGGHLMLAADSARMVD